MYDASPYYPPSEDTPRPLRRELSEGCDCCRAFGQFKRAEKEDNLGHILCRPCYNGTCGHGENK